MIRWTLLLGALVLLAVTALLLPFGALDDLLHTDPHLARMVLIELRLPRVLLAVGYGATLGLTGAALQALFANPLASPDLTGGSSGAALGAVAGGYWLGLSHPLALAAAGAGGALLALALLLALAGRRSDTAALLLAGLAISLAAGAATSLLLALAPSPFAFYDSFTWLMGSLVDRSVPQAAAALIPATIAGALLLRHVRSLDLLALGEDVAAAAGYRPSAMRLKIVSLSAVAVGACVAVCGAVGFIGLIAPVIARRFTGGHPGRALLPAALLGALLMTGADLLTRLAPPGRDIPLGVITAIAGTPLFLWVVTRMRWRLTP
ncbi:iron chelate uptake ABC transporter family permease subunit [Sphingomonas arenae]|uniref:iron chelate uptake ABC transporter family permease subunit n=1 Tax=Sphingomonas arenae TaxID=2812555 RepID=UPI0019672853|nr:iron chelate uptake ABC transporter family permease subunit [Sphingomonas arenae]